MSVKFRVNLRKMLQQLEVYVPSGKRVRISDLMACLDSFRYAQWPTDVDHDALYEHFLSEDKRPRIGRLAVCVEKGDHK